MKRPRRVLIAPRAFRGTITNLEACETMICAFHDAAPEISVDAVPLSTGGAGALNTFETLGPSVRRSEPLLSPSGKTVDTEYVYLINERTAFLELQQLYGIDKFDRTTPCIHNTHEIGELFSTVTRLGAKRIVIAPGGIATLDVGCGLARALGAKFLAPDGSITEPGIISVKNTYYLDRSSVSELTVLMLCDTAQTLLGENGILETYPYANKKFYSYKPQLLHSYACLKKLLHPEIADVPGDGAGGGIAYMLRALVNAQLMDAGDATLNFVKFRSRAARADLILTGEGCLDKHSFDGILGGILRRAGKTPVTAIVGSVGAGIGKDARRLERIIPATPNLKYPPRTPETAMKYLYQATYRYAKELARLEP